MEAVANCHRQTKASGDLPHSDQKTSDVRSFRMAATGVIAFRIRLGGSVRESFSIHEQNPLPWRIVPREDSIQRERHGLRVGRAENHGAYSPTPDKQLRTSEVVHLVNPIDQAP